MQHAAVDAHGLVLLKHAVGAQLGQPDVEDLVALGLTEGEQSSVFHSPDRVLALVRCCCYLEVVQAVSSIQVYTFRLLVDGHDSQADVQRTVELPFRDLKRNGRASNSVAVTRRDVRSRLTSCWVLEYARIPFSNMKYL